MLYTSKSVKKDVEWQCLHHSSSPAIPIGSGLGFVLGGAPSEWRCCENYFFLITFFNLRWGLRITPGLTFLSAILVLFFLYDPPRSSLPFLIFFATLQGRRRLPENLFSMQKGAKARGKRRRLSSALPGCKTSNIFSPSKVSSSTLSVRLTL